MTPSEEIQGQRLFSAIPNQKVGRKFGNISLVNHSQIIEKNRKIQGPIQLTGVQ